MTKYTSYQDRYFAEQLLLKRPQSSYDSLASAMSGVKVDLNPHQVDAALFAMQSPLSSGVLMADEVGLGKRLSLFRKRLFNHSCLLSRGIILLS